MALAPEVLMKLAAPLDPSRVKHREGSGGRSLSYLEGHDVVRAANNVFGIGNWGYRVEELTLLGEEPVVKTYNGQTREGFRVAYRAVVQAGSGEVTYSDVGFGDAMEYTGSKLTPHELASKEAVTDALKRALKNFGDQFGLCLYDKDAPEHSGRNGSAVAVGGSVNGGGVGDGGSRANDQAAPAPTSSDGEWVYPFGKKHKGKTVAQVESEDPGWHDWYLKEGGKEDIKARINEHRNLAALGGPGGGYVDDSEGIPFDRSIDGIGN